VRHDAPSDGDDSALKFAIIRAILGGEDCTRDASTALGIDKNPARSVRPRLTSISPPVLFETQRGTNFISSRLAVRSENFAQDSNFVRSCFL
jgi:hypothetical protein